ncbi:MAG: EVE domain-containing protein [Rhodospirillaceae bacterium]
MAYWLMKSEPFKYSWDRLVSEGRTHWDGVRNFQAANNLKAMKLGERGFFYHSNEGLEIVGVVEIVKEYYPDPSDPVGRFGMVDVRPLLRLTKSVTLKQIKADPVLAEMALLRQSRLSVSPVSDAEWRHICVLGGVAV